MKKIISIIVIAVICTSQNFCFASDTLIIVFNTADKNQRVTKTVKSCYNLTSKNEKLCTFDKSCWYRYNLKDSTGTSEWQFVFTYQVVGDSLSMNEAISEIKAVKLSRALGKLYKSIKNKRSDSARKIAKEIEDLKKNAGKENSFFKNLALYLDNSNVVYLSKIKTKIQLVELKNRIRDSKIFLIDLSKQRNNIKLVAYKVSAVNLAPIEGKSLRF